MLGAIAGDVIGSVYEGRPIKSEKFPLFAADAVFTDDTVLTAATAWAILHREPYERAYQTFGRKYPHAGYGGTFIGWIHSDDPRPYNSWGNGSAMRVSPVGFAFDDEETVLAEARRSAEVTHNHPEGIKGAQATALTIFLAWKGADKAAIRDAISERFGYDLDRRLKNIRPGHRFDVSCQGSVPEAMIAFFDSANYEDAVRKAISLGGDADTQACIAGGIAQAFYGGVPKTIAEETRKRLPEEFLDILAQFEKRFPAAAP
ncbi:MAG: ADP-ribosylglycohydrolase family protein [Desulfococcaceae bacterium]